MIGDKGELEGILGELELLRKRILIVEDDEDKRDVAEKTFYGEKVKIDFAANAQEALELLTTIDYYGAILAEKSEEGWQDVLRHVNERGIPYVFYINYPLSRNEKQPCMIFIDEICALMEKGIPTYSRECEAGWQEAYQVLNGLVNDPGKWQKEHGAFEWYFENRAGIRATMEKKEARIRARQNGDNNV